MKKLQEQLHLIKRGVLLLIEPSELEQKIKNSIASGKPLVIKLGVDPTAPDIHLGHTVPLRKLRHFQDFGHKVTFLIGDFTAQIGDPSGRDKTRPPLTREAIHENAETYLKQVAKILDRDKLEVVYNSDWLDKLSFGELIKMAANTTVAKMLEHNTFKKRLDNSYSIRMHELLYPFMQGYDSVALAADVELGGSDQTFNLTFGRDLQRFYGQEPQICITLPILTGTDGVQKMSKSLGNYIGIDEAPASMFNKLMQMADSNIINYFTLLTDVPETELAELEKNLLSNPKTAFIINAKKKLAFEIIKTYYTEGIAQQQIDSYGKMDKEGLPQINLKKILDNGKLDIIALMTTKLGFGSNGEARRQIVGGAVSINGIKLSKKEQFVRLLDGDVLKCSKTKIYKVIIDE
jgi:tyrosyl-tRNA synthetase